MKLKIRLKSWQELTIDGGAGYTTLSAYITAITGTHIIAVTSERGQNTAFKISEIEMIMEQ